MTDSEVPDSSRARAARPRAGIVACLWALGWLGAASAAPLDDFIAAAKEKHGAEGEKAARFLADNMPASDRQKLGADFLSENLALALQAREEFPWAKAVPEEIFLNDVLPYAVFDEPRDPWRADFQAKARELVKDAKTLTEATQALNQGFFKIVNVHYNTGRKRTNQSPKESMESGMATCTGLSILLVDACRAVGIPARAAGTAMWSNGRGNHTWVEIWDGGWHFTGADEYDPAGLDRGWFTGDAAKAESDLIEHAIYATSWKREPGQFFPLIWAQQNREVAAVNVTARYTANRDTAPKDGAEAGVRLFDQPHGERVVAQVRIIDASGRELGQGETRAGTTDLNDMPRFHLQPGARVWVRFTREGETRELAAGPFEKGEPTVEAAWSALAPVPAAVAKVEAWLAKPVAERKGDAPELQAALSRDEAARVRDLLTGDRLRQLENERKDELGNKTIVVGDKTLRWLERTFGEAPAGSRSLWISMHGGGEAPKELNDQQWQNQIRLYEPAEGIYIAPRAPTNTWNMWHQDHIDPMFDRMIEDYVALRGVSPDKIYLMGYSAGGDGVWQVAPRMADRFAAAAMMAGHPNEAQLYGLRDLPFALFVGSRDEGVGRNKVVAERAVAMDQLAKDDPGGYIHLSRVYEGLGHWMDRKDAEAVPWMAGFTRQPWPKKIVWFQDDVTHDRFYWLKIPDKAAAKAGQKIVATVEGQEIRLEGDVPAGMELRLSDELLNLDDAVTVKANGKEVAATRVPRTAAAILRSLAEKADGPAAGTAALTLP